MQGQNLLHKAVTLSVAFAVGVRCKEQALAFHRGYHLGEEVVGDDEDEPEVSRGAMSANSISVCSIASM